MIYAKVHPDKSPARKREIEIKGWRRDKKGSSFLFPFEYTADSQIDVFK